MQMRLELIPLPVSDVDRAIAFYEDKLGFTKDFDVRPSEGVRVVQLTPEGSGCSVGFGTGLDWLSSRSPKRSRSRRNARGSPSRCTRRASRTDSGRRRSRHQSCSASSVGQRHTESVERAASTSDRRPLALVNGVVDALGARCGTSQLGPQHVDLATR